MPFSTPAKPLLSRHLSVVLVVVSLHVVLIWTLQNGLLVRAAQILVPAEILSELLVTPASPQPRQAARPPKQFVAQQPLLETAPLQTFAMSSPSALVAQASLNAAGTTAPTLAPTQAITLPAPSAYATVQLPSSNADYLQNPKPPYPPLSSRLGETGKTVYKVWIGVDGKPQRAELVSSSGFARLDKAAYDTVMGWRYVPGQRGGVAELMAFNVPIHWELRN
jgi:protein TonB